MGAEAYYKYGGLSTKHTPAQLSHVESPDLLNVEFSNGNISRRNGYQFVADGFKDASIYMDGFNDYVTIPHIAAYQPTGTQGMYIGIGVVLKSLPVTASTVLARGYNAAGHAFRLYYTPAAFTWTMAVYNAAGVATTYAVTDVTGIAPNLNYHRYFEWYQSGTNLAATFKVWADDGSVMTSATTTAMVDFKVSTEPITFGARLQSEATFVAGDSPLNCSVFDLRYAVFAFGTASVTHACTDTNRYKYELTPVEILNFTGYWKCNDGTKSGTIADSTAALNHGTVPASNSAVWNKTINEFTGTAALEFKRGMQFVKMDLTVPVSYTLLPVFASGVASQWAASCIFLPRYLPGTTTIPDQCIMWAGIDPAMPQPFGLNIIADRFVLSYNNGGVLVTLTSPLVVSTAVNKRCCLIWYRDTSSTLAGPAHMRLQVMVEGISANNSVIGANAPAGTVSTLSVLWSFGRHRISSSVGATGQYTFDTDGAALGVLDSFVIYDCRTAPNAVYVGPPVPVGGLFDENIVFTSTIPYVKVLHIRFNEGAGTYLNVEVATVSNTPQSAELVPEEKDAGRWDVGYMRPYVPPEFTCITPYFRSTGSGGYNKKLLVISGCGLYSVDTDTGAVVAVGADFYKGTGVWSTTRYADKVFFATNNDMRPMVYDGTTARFLGIEAPSSPPTVTVANTASGAFLAGTYTMYYTYRNKATGEESNPSPGTVCTFVGGAGTDTITDVYVSTSPNRHVTQRRLYLTLLNGTTTAYLSVDIDDNATTNYTIDIIAPPISGVSLELYSNQAAPQASIVAVFKDYLFVAGESKNPTRVYRNSRAGAFWAFDQDQLFVDVDMDTGDPVTCLLPMADRLIADVRDGRFAVYLTGATAAPFASELIHRGRACSGRGAFTATDVGMVYVGESEVYITDGYQAVSLSTPDGPPTLPSIQYTLRTGINLARRDHVTLCRLSTKNQVWIAHSTTGNSRNNNILVFDATSKAWTRYDIPADYIASVDDTNDIEVIYAGIFGRIYKVDTGVFDGVPTLTAGVVASSTTTSITVTGTPFTAGALEGRRVYVYRAATADVVSYTVYTNTNNTLVVYEAVAGLTAADVLGVGLVPFYIEFSLDFGDPLAVKRLRWIKLVGTSDNAGNVLRLTYKPAMLTRSFNQTDATNSFIQWVDTDTYKVHQIGGLGRTFRVRLSESGASGLIPTFPLPSIFGTITIDGIAFEAEVVDVL